MFRTLIEWTDPAGNRHEVGTVETIDKTIVFDWANLLSIGTIESVPDAPVIPPAAPITQGGI